MIFTVTLNPALDWELTVPAFAFDTVLRATSSAVDAGGKGFNVSRALAALEVPSCALGFVGGSTGQRLAGMLGAMDIATSLVWIAGETRTNVSIVAAEQGRYLKVNEPGPAIRAEEQAALLARVQELTRPGDWWVLAGSLPPGVVSKFYGDLIAVIQQAGARAILDSSGEPLRLGCAAGVWLVKPNLDEAGQITGLMLTPERAAEALQPIHALGAEHVLISLGRAGAVLSDGRQAWRLRPPQVDEHNPIGAGDALVAGLVAGLCRGEALPDAAALGVACGAAAASLPGTAFGTRAQVEALRKGVTLTPLSPP
ncbi:MAG: 1-phosphofructokinase [Anaerolineae bacterium]|nr:1-phosphofructokinase [Anaerolineae bacterium]